jgi:hypothetical protein
MKLSLTAAHKPAASAVLAGAYDIPPGYLALQASQNQAIAGYPDAKIRARMGA